jgi:hypothetical protein
MPGSVIAGRMGALCYVVWAFLHFQAAWAVFHMGEGMASSPARGRVLQDAWNLLAFAVAALWLAATLNWRGHRWGFWINLGVISVADLGFVLFVLAPGYAPLWPGVLGPVFWVAGAALTAWGLAPRRRAP